MSVVLLPFGPLLPYQYTHVLSTDEPCASEAQYFSLKEIVLFCLGANVKIYVLNKIWMQADRALVHSAPWQSRRNPFYLSALLSHRRALLSPMKLRIPLEVGAHLPENRDYVFLIILSL